jgi:hypothetical protein
MDELLNDEQAARVVQIVIVVLSNAVACRDVAASVRCVVLWRVVAWRVAMRFKC